VKRQAISPVIATVIIVAITIAVAIAVAFWMTGIIGTFTSFEQISIETIYAQPTSDGKGWTVTLVASNKGTAPTSITDIFINGVLAATQSSSTTTQSSSTTACSGVKLSQPSQLPIALNPGNSTTIQLTVQKGGTCGATQFIAGQSIEVKLHSSGGKDYPKLVVLP